MVKKAEEKDLTIIAEMAAVLWDCHSVEELADEFAGIIEGGEAQIFVKYIQGVPIGFAQCGLRHDYVEGTDSSPVGYLEGIFVKKEYRRQGYAKELLSNCELWAKEQGCTEFASDCELSNGDSFEFHRNMEFEEANRIICFKKKLLSP